VTPNARILVCGEAAYDAGLLHAILERPGRGMERAFADEGYEDATFDPTVHAGLVVLGSDRAESCHDEAAYRVELRLLRAALAAKKPVLGICAGAQLIAHLYGYRPRTGTPKADKNLTRLSLTAAGEKDPVLRHAAPPAEVTQSHWDTFEAPDGAVELARSRNTTRPHCDAFKLAGVVYALQFHPEPTRDMLLNDRWWYRFRPTPAQVSDVSEAGRRMLEAWVRLALGEPLH
jgi:GMP synthase-like glutamine amidotransferase